MQQRPIAHLPRTLLWGLPLVLLLQLLIASQWPVASQTIESLPTPPAQVLLQALTAAEPRLSSRAISLWLQNFDYQQGRSLALAQLDYQRLQDWLEASLQLDAGSRYPLMSAAYLYAEVADSQRSRQMIDFIAVQFEADPARRWRWMLHAVLLARHRVNDLSLALDLSRRLSACSELVELPVWVEQLPILLLEQLGEQQQAAELIAALLQGGEVVDPAERAFLRHRFARLQAEGTISADR